MVSQDKERYTVMATRSLEWIAKERSWPRPTTVQHNGQVATAVAGWREDEFVARSRVRQTGRAHFYYGVVSAGQMRKAGRCIAKVALVEERSKTSKDFWEKVPGWLVDGFEQERMSYVELSIQAWEIRVYHETWPDVEWMGLGYCTRFLGAEATKEYRRLQHENGTGAAAKDENKTGHSKRNSAAVAAQKTKRTATSKKDTARFRRLDYRSPDLQIIALGSALMKTMKRCINKLPLNGGALPKAISEMRYLLAETTDLDLPTAQRALRHGTRAVMQRVYDECSYDYSDNEDDQQRGETRKPKPPPFSRPRPIGHGHPYDYTAAWAKLASVLLHAALIGGEDQRAGGEDQRDDEDASETSLKRVNAERTWMKMA